jgi:hypothetical protein
VTRAIAATQQLVSFCDAIRFDPRSIQYFVLVSEEATDFQAPQTSA